MMQPGSIPPPSFPQQQQNNPYINPVPNPYAHQQQYGQPQPPQQQQQPWMIPPPQQQQAVSQPAPGAQQVWGQQQLQQQQYQGGGDEVRSLWIGDLQYWMDENYLWTCFSPSGELQSVKVIRNKQTLQPEGYGFLEFGSRATAERVLLTFNGQPMPNSEQQAFRLNWATPGAGQKKQDESSPEYTIFVGDLAADVTDYLLQETFRMQFPSVKGAKVITDHATGRSKGYGFVKFGDESEQIKAMTMMNGMYCSSRPMRIGPAASKKPVTVQQKASPQAASGNPGEDDPNNTTIFVGGLDPNVSEDQLRQVFSQFGELVHVKVPLGKRCGFVQFASRACAEQALQTLNGAAIGGQNVRLSWGRGPSNKQAQPDATQWNGAGYYGYTQGYDSYGYAAAAAAAAAPPQDPNMYYANYPGYANYQQPQQ